MEGERKHCVVGFLLICSLLVGASPGWAQAVGQVGGVEGTAEALRQGTLSWTALAMRNEVLFRDQLRTQALSKLKVLFQDDSTLTLGENSQVTVDEQIIQPGAAPTSVFSLLGGKVQAFATERYQLPGARFELRTPTAVAGVRGTGFIADHELPPVDTSLVVGVANRTRVDAINGLNPGEPCYGKEVFLGPQEFTLVRRGQCPTPPQRMADAQFLSLIEATTIKEPLLGTKGKVLSGIAAALAVSLGTCAADGCFDDGKSRKVASPSQ